MRASAGPVAARVRTSITPPFPPGPSSGEAGVIDTRISAMSVAAIAVRSKLPL
jgi:hypothetical protein